MIDLDEMMGFLITTGQVDENFGLKEQPEIESEDDDDDSDDIYNQ